MGIKAYLKDIEKLTYKGSYEDELITAKILDDMTQQEKYDLACWAQNLMREDEKYVIDVFAIMFSAGVIKGMKEVSHD